MLGVKIILFLVGIMFIGCGIRMFINKYHYLPIDKKVEDYQKTTGCIQRIEKNKKARISNSSNSRRYYYIVYVPIIKFWNGQNYVLAKINGDFQKQNMFQIGDEIEIFYEKLNTNLKQNFIDLKKEIIPDFIQSDNFKNNNDISFDYEVYFANPDIYNNEYPKWNKIALFLGGIICLFLGIIV